MSTTEIGTAANALQDATELAAAVHANLAGVIRGKPEALRLAVAAILAGGHVLVEDVPGVGKTLLAKALARSIGGTFRRARAGSGSRAPRTDPVAATCRRPR